MSDTPFVGPSYNLDSRPASVQRTVNMMPVPLEPGNERAGWVFRDVPGLNEVTLTEYVAPPELVILRLTLDDDFLDQSTFARAYTRYTQSGRNDEPAAAIQTTAKKYGVGAYRTEYGLADGFSNGIPTYANGPECAMSGDFTIQAWVNTGNVFLNPVTVASSTRIRPDFSLSQTGEWHLHFGTAGTFFEFWDGAVKKTVSFAQVMPVRAWTHIAVVRTAGVFKCYMGGVHYTGTSSELTDTTTIGGVYPIAIGGARSSYATTPDFMQRSGAFLSYVDDVMISLLSEYSTDFTPPTAALRLR